MMISARMCLNSRAVWPIITGNTPAMPLSEAHFGGFFYARLLCFGDLG